MVNNNEQYNILSSTYIILRQPLSKQWVAGVGGSQVAP